MPQNKSPKSIRTLQTEKYARLGYKRVILDYHYSEFVPETLVDADPKAIVDAMAYLGLDSLLLYAKDQWGNVYHDTKISHRHKNVPYDLFGQVSKGLKEKGIETIAYFTVNWDEGAARAHPEWKVMDAHGGRVLDGGGEPTAARWAFLCLNTPYREYAIEQVRELVDNYDIAALFLDIILYWPGANECYCPCCQQRWREQYGSDIPKVFTPETQARYLDFITETLRGFHLQVKDIIEASGKDIWTTHNYGTYYDLDDYAVMEIDPFGRDYFRSSQLAKTFRARMNGGEVELIGHRHNGVWDFTVKPALTLQWEAATAVANDCAIMYVDQPNLRGDLDPLVYRTMKKAFDTAAELEPHVRGTTPYAEVGLFDSERSMVLNGTENRDQSGAYKMLTELHMPFDMISDIHLSIEALKRFQLLIVPNTNYITERNRGIIKQYVEEGGNLLFCYHSAFGDEMGRDIEGKAFGMLQPTGSSGQKVDFVKPVYAEADRDMAETRLKVKGFETFNAPADAEVLATYTPPCIDVTPELWVAHRPMPGADTDRPAGILGRCGKGQFIYWGARVFKEYLYQNHPAIRQFAAYCIERLVDNRVRTRAPRTVEAVYVRDGSTFKILLINGTSSKACAHMPANMEDELIFHTNIDELIPIHDIEIEMKGFKIVGAENLAGESLIFSVDGVSLPRLDLYDVVIVHTL